MWKKSVLSMDNKLDRKDYHEYTVEVYPCFPKVGFYWWLNQFVQQLTDEEIIHNILTRMH